LLGFIAMSGLVLLQLFYLQRLADWLDNPASSRLPDGWGAWTDIFPGFINRAEEMKKSGRAD
jgi:two-component system phosphate regulon sensor histidine kinase PhoR